MDVSTASDSSLFELDEPICPYTGLRTFTENEAIYFRGRVSHVARCLTLLVEQRFVMITGASGDGKSSLVFAGMLPEVRAGFVRARYSSWAVATFRPERSPLRNLAQALTTALRLPSSSSVETELGRGFSSLVQLYQTSKLCPSSATPPEGLTPTEQRQQQREAANLLLVVDQFEEFFTNPENYDGDVPNTAAQTTVNLLLETVRLAQAQDLPIYIVCTMRSDFVGQCAEFRGLIEQVGASQYFVPRLLRHEFLEVIKQPALLSGNHISERLVQRLLYDIGQGQDQLPVLQHALRRIWLAADEGREEMDLIHYAMVGGLADELPPEDQARFAAWRATLSAEQRAFLLDAPGLRNVLDAHANQLYFEANDLYNRDFQPPLPPGTATRVIEQTFRVLTRTDGKRVVRNRVTGAQLTTILDDAALPWPVVCRILRPFRAEGTTFLAPFLSEGADDRAVLPPDTVLDISHESLIRNWTRLTEWARKEAEDVHLASDFKQQAGLWQEKAESRGYLLAIGPYKLFADWHANKPGADNWLAYYQAANPDASLGPGPVAAQIGVLKRYLDTSRRHLWSELLAARYGVWRLAAIILVPIVLLVGGMWWWAQRQKQSDYAANLLVQSGLLELKKSNQLLKNRAVLLADTRRLDTLISKYNNRYGADTTGNARYERYKKQYPKDSARYAQNLADLRALTLPVNDIARFVITADRLRGVMKDGIYRPWFGSRQAYAFPQLLDTLQNTPAALEVELSMYASVDNLDYDQTEGENPSAQPILRDLVRRLTKAGDITKPIGNSPTLSEQRLLAVLTARTIMALSYYLTSDSLQQARPSQPAANQASHQDARLVFGKQRKQLLRNLGEYVRQESRATAGQAPETDGFAYCLQVLLGQGHHSQQDLAFLQPLTPFGTDSVQFLRLLGNDYATAAIAFAALGRPDRVVRCLDTLAHTARAAGYYPELSSKYVALLPYLVKYGLLTAPTAPALLAKCAQANGTPFNGMYAATVYGLLSVKPSTTVFQAANTSYTGTDASGLWTYPAVLGYAGISYQALDLVSFSLPVAARDTAWAVLQGAIPAIARQQDILTSEIAPKNINYNALFLTAFWAKMHGVYLHEFKHAAEPFNEYNQAFLSLQQALANGAAGKPARHPLPIAPPQNQPGWELNAPEWNLTLREPTSSEAEARSKQRPLAFLSLPVRPHTLDFAAYYTCSFDSFFLYELAQATSQPATVRLLDSLAFREAAFPDRNNGDLSFRDGQAMLKAALNRSPQYVPNLVLIRAIAQFDVPGDSIRRQRNGILLAIEETLHNSSQLRDSAYTRNLTRRLLESTQQMDASFRHNSFRFLKGLFNDKKMSPGTRALMYRNLRVARSNNDKAFMAPLAVAFSDLATALAHEGQAEEAFALANAFRKFGRLGEAGIVPTTIRISEQAMLTDNRRKVPQDLINQFLWKYLLENKAGRVLDNNDEAEGAASIFNLCFWRPLADQPDSVALIAPSLIYQLSGEGLNTGLNAPFKAGGLADQVNLARQRLENSPFMRGNSRLKHIGYILLGYAHLKTRQTVGGWREYDEAELIMPADY